MLWVANRRTTGLGESLHVQGGVRANPVDSGTDGSRSLAVTARFPLE